MTIGGNRIRCVDKETRQSYDTAMLKWQAERKRGERGWYQSYLRSHHWRRKRKAILAKRRWTCQRCGYVDPNQDGQRGTRLDVHHKTYDRLGKEKDSDLEVLCHKCHRRRH
jgi:5-methylcytosine-specific restriction endonuclease McrA